ncbi:MAG: hypothetical protein GY810_08435 [Aureispira sp.]|nr:hypothetical protein [Aureispira sp.]
MLDKIWNAKLSALDSLQAFNLLFIRGFDDLFLSNNQINNNNKTQLSIKLVGYFSV